MQTRENSYQHDNSVCQRHARRHSVHGPRNRHTDPILVWPGWVGTPNVFDCSTRRSGTEPRKHGIQCVRRFELALDDSFNAPGQACPEETWPGASGRSRQDSFRIDGQWADSRPSPTERWREVCRSVVAIGAKIVVKGHVPRQLESAMSGRRAGVDWSLDLMRAADRRETTSQGMRCGPPEPLSWMLFRFTMSAVASPVFRFLRDVPVDFPPPHKQTG